MAFHVELELGGIKMPNKKIKPYGLAVKGIIPMDLSTCYMQNCPNVDMQRMFRKRVRRKKIKANFFMTNSPHYHIAKMYYENGKRYTKAHLEETDYYRMCKEFLGKDSVGLKKIFSVCDSIKRGYRRSSYKNEHIVVLMEPFARTRYLRDVRDWVPEIWSGHHRAGALLALGQNVVKVLVAEDANPGSKYCVGKVHGYCKKK